MIFRSIGAFAAVTLAASIASSSRAAEILTFGDTGCNFVGSVCKIPQTYGDTPGVDVSYRAFKADTGLTSEPYLRYWGRYGDLNGVVYAGGNPTDAGEITFTAASGFKVSLLDFDIATYDGAAASAQFTVLDLAGNVLQAFTGQTQWPKHSHADINTAFLDGVILRWGPDGYNVGLDNIRFEAQAMTSGAVPEPATWAMMILGFGASGWALRRRARVGIPALRPRAV